MTTARGLIVPHPYNEATVQQLQTLFDVGVVAALSDCELLEKFTRRRGQAAEAAFAVLVERYGSMVLRVCRGIVGNEQDAQDAFQATFFILARKGDGLWVRDSLGPWLHRVACRAATRIKASTDRQRAILRRAAELAAGQTELPACDDWGWMVHEEVDRLPQYYRLPVVLCDLEGHSYEAASRSLGCPIGTVKSRLARGRERLRHRLVRRGVDFSSTAAILPVLVKEPIPSALSKSTIEYVMWIKLGSGATAGAFSASAIALSEGVLRAMYFTKIRTAAAVVVVAGVAVTGLGLWVSGRAAELRIRAEQQAERAKSKAKAEAPTAPENLPAKPDSTAASVPASMPEPDEDDFQTPERVIVLGDRSKVWAYGPKTKSWHTYTAHKGITIQPIFGNGSRWSGLVALSYSGEPIDEIAVFSKKSEKWIRLPLAEPALGKELSPLVQQNYAIYLTGRHAYAFSAVTGKWSQQALKEPGQDPYIRSGGPHYTIYHDSRTIHAFSPLKGTWKTMEVEKGAIAQVQLQAGPANTALIVNGSRLYSYDPRKAEFEEVQANED